jgi:FMN reductase
MSRVAVVSAGVSVPSSTRLLADRLVAALGTALDGAELDVIHVELREHAHALADAVLTGFPPTSLARSVRAVESADAVIAVTPVFSASYSGLFKSFVDVLDKEALRRTPVLIGATAGTARHSLVLEHAMRPLFSYLGALVVPTGVFAATEDFGQRGLDERIARAAGELAGLLEQRPPAAQRDDFEDVVPFTELLRDASNPSEAPTPR